MNGYLYTPKTFFVINHCNLLHNIFWLSTLKVREEKMHLNVSSIKKIIYAKTLPISIKQQCKLKQMANNLFPLS